MKIISDTILKFSQLEKFKDNLNYTKLTDIIKTGTYES